MSFSRTDTPPASRTGDPTIGVPTEGDPADESPDAPSGTPYQETPDWGRIGALAAGIVIGAVIGAGSALLFAPQSGRDTRRAMRRAARRGQNRAVEAWDHLGDELSWMARRKKKQLRRGVTRSGWALEDLLDSVVGRAHGRRPQKRHEEDDAPRKEQIIVEED